MTSRVAKANLIRYAIQTWHPLLIIDEVSCNKGYADLFVLKPNMESIEIEVKMLLSDLIHNEMKKRKYEEEFWKYPGGGLHGEHITNFFYIYVPPNLRDKSLVYLQENIPFAGLLSANVLNHKRAKKLHNRKMTDAVFKQFQRIQSRKYAFTKANELDPL